MPMAEPSLILRGARWTMSDRASCLSGKPVSSASIISLPMSIESKNFCRSHSMVMVRWPSYVASSASSALSSAARTAEAPAVAESPLKALSRSYSATSSLSNSINSL